MSYDSLNQYDTNNDDDNNKVNNDLRLQNDKGELVFTDNGPVYVEREKPSPEKKFDEESVESSSTLDELIENIEDVKSLNKQTLENIFYTADQENSGDIESNEQDENKKQEPNYDISSIRKNLFDNGLSLVQIDSILKAYFNIEGVEKKELIKQAKDTKQLVYLISKLNSINNLNSSSDYGSEDLAKMIKYIKNIRKEGYFYGITRSEGLRDKVFEIAVNESKNINELNTILKNIPYGKKTYSEQLKLLDKLDKVSNKETLDNESNEENLDNESNKENLDNESNKETLASHLYVIDKILETEGEDRLKIKVIDLTIKNALETSTSEEDFRSRLTKIDSKIKAIDNKLQALFKNNPELSLKYNHQYILNDLKHQKEYKKRNDKYETLPVQSQVLISFNELRDTLFKNNIEEISNDYSTQDRNLSSTEQKSNTEKLSEDEISEIESVTTIEDLSDLAKKLEASGIKSSAGGQLFSENIANKFKNKKYISESDLQYFSSKHGIRAAFKKLLEVRDKEITAKITAIDNISTLINTVTFYENKGYRSSVNTLLIPKDIKDKLQTGAELSDKDFTTISGTFGIRETVTKILSPKEPKSSKDTAIDKAKGFMSIFKRDKK